MIPGAGIYYTTNHLIQGDSASFAAQGKETIAVAGVIAAGILLTASIVRLFYESKANKQRKELR